MNSLIPIETNKIGGDSVQSVNARDLHAFLGVGRKWSSWIQGRIDEFGFSEDVDFIRVVPQTGTALRRFQVEYILSIEMAKHVAMIERTEKGKKVRDYFIAAEKKLRAVENSKPWLQARNEGKYARRSLTDVIARFVAYAEAQGSSSPKFYFMNYTKLVNKALFILDTKKPKNFRDNLSIAQIHQVAVAENRLIEVLESGMAAGRFYKSISVDAKLAMSLLAAAIGQSVVVVGSARPRLKTSTRELAHANR